MCAWFKDAADKLRRELDKDTIKNVKGNDFLIGYLKENQPDEYTDDGMVFDDDAIDEIARLKIDEFEEWLKVNCDDWLYFGNGYLWIDKAKHKVKKKKKPIVTEPVLSSDEKLVLQKSLSSINHNDSEMLENLFQKMLGYSDDVAIADCALRRAYANERSHTTLTFDKAKIWEVAGDKAKNADKPGFYKSYIKSADIYSGNMSHIEAARLYDKAIKGYPESDREKNIEHILSIARKLRMQYELSGDTVLASKVFIMENDIKLEKLTGLKYRLFQLYKLTSDYGQAPIKVAVCAGVIIFLCAILYTFLGIKSTSPPATVNSFFTSLYYSVVTFTTLGYGDFSPTENFARILSSIEAIIGVILTSLFMVSFVRKYSR